MPELSSSIGGGARTVSGSNVSTNPPGDASSSTVQGRMGTHLDQAIRFLQEQHQLMLSSLQQEVEQLRQRNRGISKKILNTVEQNFPNCAPQRPGPLDCSLSAL